MAYQRPSIAATDEEMHTSSWSSPADAWPDKRALYPKEGQETEEQKAFLPGIRLFECFGAG